jgi:hypothetical protein
MCTKASEPVTWEVAVEAQYEPSDQVLCCPSWPSREDIAARGKVAELPKSQGCTALTTELGLNCAEVVAGFDLGAFGVWQWLPGQLLAQAHTARTRDAAPLRFSSAAGQIRCIDLDRREQGKMDICVGTETGMAMKWEYDPNALDLVPAIQRWPAHSKTPSAVAQFSGVSAVALSRGVAVTGGADGAACVWGGPGFGRLERRIDSAHSGAVTAVALQVPATAGKEPEQGSWRAITGGEDGVVRVWWRDGEMVMPRHKRDTCAATETEILRPPGMGTPARPRGRGSTRGRDSHRGINGIALDSTCQRLCTASEDSLLRIWDFAVCKPVARLGALEQGAAPPRYALKGARAVSFDSGDMPFHMASGSSDGTWWLWDVRDRMAAIKKPLAHAGIPVVSLAVRDNMLLSGGLEAGSGALGDSPSGSCALWDLRATATPLDAVKLVAPETEREVSCEIAISHGGMRAGSIGGEWSDADMQKPCSLTPPETASDPSMWTLKQSM